jgi:hypothetical protein
MDPADNADPPTTRQEKGKDSEIASISIIKIVLYVIAFVIILITLITIINYSLYTIYSIQAVVKEQTYSDSPYFKQKDIYNYMLINYIHLLKKKNYNVTYTYHKSYDLVNVKEANNIDDANENDNKIKYETDNVALKAYLDSDDKAKRTDFEKYKSALEKWLRTEVINDDKEYYIIAGATDEKKYIIGEKNENPAPASVLSLTPVMTIPNNVMEELNILHDQDTNYVLIQRGKPNGLDKIAEEKDVGGIGSIGSIGVYDMYKKNINNTQNIYGYFSKFIGEIYPLSLINMNDDKASSLYIQVNNSFYELVLMLIFVIVLIIFILIIYTFYYNIIVTLSSSEQDDGSSDSRNVITELLGNYKHLSLIILAIVVYCLIHGIIYKYLFITNVYDRVYEMYDELIKPDTYVSSCVNIYRKKHRFDDNVLDILKEMSHNGTINIYNANQYTVVNYGKVAEVSIQKQIEEFTSIMLDINKNFTTSNYTYNYYTNKLFTSIYNEINTPIDTSADAIAIAADAEYKSTILFVLIIYIYFINNNKEDPYIIIKLNKLIFGTVANIGIPEIDKDIEYTLLLRSLVFEKLDIENMKTYITNVKDGVFKWSQKEGKTENTQISTSVNTKVKNFISLFATTNDNLNFWTPVYFLNLYLAVEIGLNLFLILSVLIIISTYSGSTDIQSYINTVKGYINQAIEELKTAVIGVI